MESKVVRALQKNRVYLPTANYRETQATGWLALLQKSGLALMR